MGKIKKMLFNLKEHWYYAPTNKYVSNKEIFSFSIGGMGVKSLNSLLTYMTLTSTCLLFGSVYGLSPRHFVILTIITNLISLIKTPFVSMIVDNTHTKIGKFRPYLLWAGIPTMIGIIGLAYIPLNTHVITRVVLVGILINLVTITQPLYNNAYMGISQIITPDSQERTKILSLSELLGNLGPSLVQFLLPTLAGLIYGDDCMTNINTYRIFVPLFAISGFILGLLCLYNTRERVLTDKAYTKIPFVKGMRELSKNKYFWIVSISKFFDGFKGGLGVLLAWVCTYQIGKSSLLGIVQTIVSLGFTPGIILAPLIMKKLGSKKAAFFTHILNCIMAMLMLFTFKKGFVFFVIALFCYNFAQGPQYVIQTSLLSDGLDYHQDKHGSRLEGFAQNFMLMICTIGTILSTVVFSFIYEKFGLVADAETGFTDYSILVNDEIREPIIQWVVIVVAISGLLSALPYLLYDLKECDMIDIRKRLEYKKFIYNMGYENQDEEFVLSEYNRYMQNQELQPDYDSDTVNTKNLEDYHGYDRIYMLEQEHKSDIKKAKDDMLQKGMSDKDIKIQLSQKQREYRDNLNHEKLLLKQNTNDDIKEYKAKRKEFIKNYVKDKKANGEKLFLKTMAKEAFEDLMIKEIRDENNKTK